MDSSRKRKANNATPSNTDGSATKKIKLVVRVPLLYAVFLRYDSRLQIAYRRTVHGCVCACLTAVVRGVGGVAKEKTSRDGSSACAREHGRHWTLKTQPTTRHLRHTPLIHRDHLATTAHTNDPDGESRHAEN
jgi:hypothetical protein